MPIKIDVDVQRSWDESKAQAAPEIAECRRREAAFILKSRERYEIVKRQFDEKFEEMFGNEQSTRPKSD